MLKNRIFILALLLTLVACSSSPDKQRATVNVFSLTEPPVILATEQQKAEFIATHYWDNFNFADTVLVTRTEITEPIFADFLKILYGAPALVIEKSIAAMMTKASADSIVYAHFVELSEKYLYDPNSPYRNEDIYITFLRNIIANEKLDDIYKVRSHYQLDMALRNRAGDKATDFEYTTPKGDKYTLYTTKGDPLLLFFQVSDCPTCRKVKTYVKDKGIDKRVKILYVNPKTDTHLDTLYDLRASPTLYLLDKDKRVIFKDTPIEQIEQYMTTQYEKSYKNRRTRASPSATTGDSSYRNDHHAYGISCNFPHISLFTAVTK